MCDGYENVADVEENNMFDNKKDLKTRLHMMMMWTNYQFKVHKQNTSLLIVRFMDSNCSWRIRGMRVMNTPCWMITKFVREHTCAINHKRDDHR